MMAAVIYKITCQGVVWLTREAKAGGSLGPRVLGYNVLCLSGVCTKFGISVVASKKWRTTGYLRRSE